MMNELQFAAKAVQIYAESHPRPVQVNKVQAAQMLNVHYHTVTAMVKSGIIKLNKCGMISMSEIDNALLSRAA